MSVAQTARDDRRLYLYAVMAVDSVVGVELVRLNRGVVR